MLVLTINVGINPDAEAQPAPNNNFGKLSEELIPRADSIIGMIPILFPNFYFGVHTLRLKNKFAKEKKLWVKELVSETSTAFSYWEFDIKFIHISSEGKYYPLLSVIDVYSRYLIGFMFQKSIKQADVVGFFDALICDFQFLNTVYVRNEHGSQFESKLVREYFASKGIVQEFTLPATP